jgi:uroporphyrinogen decarboxylase
MMEFQTDFIIETLRPSIDRIDIDMAELKEDMAYKHAPMISPAMFKRFMYPQYVRLISFLKAHGVKHVYVDCDGYPGNELIALWLDAGVDAISPCEVAAGNEIMKLRADFPGLGLYGGIDKRALARSHREIDQEVLGKVPWMLKRGGYIPHIDHAIPHDVPLENYQYYRKLLTKVACGD